jgi:nucleolar protein 9
MPKELRKRGKRHKKSTTEYQAPSQEQQLPPDESPSGGPSWIVPRANSNQFNPEAPFGYVDPELKAYFRTVDDQLKEWQQNNRGDAEGDEDTDPNESALLFSFSLGGRASDLPVRHRQEDVLDGCSARDSREGARTRN